MASKLEVEVEMKSNVDKIWKSVVEATIVFPKALPNQYQSIEVVEGDGKSAGSVRLIKYPPGLFESSMTAKEKIDVVDEVKKAFGYSVIEGEVLKYYKNFKASLNLSPKAGDNNGSVVKWTCEFDKASEQVPSPQPIKDFAVKSFQDLDAYILAN